MAGPLYPHLALPPAASCLRMGVTLNKATLSEAEVAPESRLLTSSSLAAGLQNLPSGDFWHLHVDRNCLGFFHSCNLIGIL